MVLLVGALLFVRSFRNLITFDPGFREDGILVGYVNLAHLRLSGEEQYEAVQRQLADELRATPGVESVATSMHVPLDGSTWSLDIRTGADGRLLKVHLGKSRLFPNDGYSHPRRT